jgi:hypothetical protein
MLWYGMVWYGMLCYVMLCYVMLCYVMLCYVVLCHVMCVHVRAMLGMRRSPSCTHRKMLKKNDMLSDLVRMTRFCVALGLREGCGCAGAREVALEVAVDLGDALGNLRNRLVTPL